MAMKTKVLTPALIVLMSVYIPSFADQPESIADKLNSSHSGMFKQYNGSRHDDTQLCNQRATGFITVYSTNSTTQGEIDVILDGMPVGSLSSYFPGDGPTCKAANARGVITIIVPEGEHTIRASSSNLNWPGQAFTVKKCSCMLMPLS
jgi:hypothetical protein